MSAGHASSVTWGLKYITRNQSSAGHALPVTWCFKDTTKSMYHAFASFCPFFIFLNFYYVFVLPRFKFPGTTNRPRLNRKYGIGFSCCYLLQVLLWCLSFHRHCYLASILPTASRMEESKCFRSVWAEQTLEVIYKLEIFIVIILRTALF